MRTATARASVLYGLTIFAADLCAAAHAWPDIRAAVRVFDQVLLGLPFKRLSPAHASLADLPSELVELCRRYTFAQAICLSRDLKEYWTDDLGDDGNQATRQLLSAYKLEMRGQPLNPSIQHTNLELGVVALAIPAQVHTMCYRYGECTSENLWDRDETGELYWNEQDLYEIAFNLPQSAARRFKGFLVDFDIPVVKVRHRKVGYTYVTDASTNGDVQGPPRFVPPNLAIFDWARGMQFSRPSDAQPSWQLYTNALSCD
ncbi:hypothetical protein NBRC10512_002234 [Rhodotorula toruloides]|uniref:RHTO0S02e09890g1_1 n=2 Tax=Rhodotorula toruloides TaxID=5286 RepID=A0A061AHI5_RHOTO|nr:uncharacterized protein RHTO_07336 [Rhodotorula toruloides NP11]EMS23602.1 hypothetical protein RHTO_07336 [Rhodotorula toruloides NP11]CDR37024.1 RHTO0S02e09890g1_1 [Rhodotorula toruloides]